MVHGIGVDIVSIARIGRLLDSPRFVHRILTPTERLEKLTPEYVAGRWAAKEAFAKALGRACSWQDVQVLRSEQGMPRLEALKNGLLPSGARVHVSISHEREHAVAMAIVELDRTNF